MFNVGGNCPTMREMQTHVHVDTRKKHSTEVEKRISKAIQGLGDRRYLKRTSGAVQSKIHNAAKQVFVDPKDPTKVYAVGLMALKRAGVNPSEADYRAFAEASAKVRAQVVVQPKKERDEKVRSEAALQPKKEWDEIDLAKALNKLERIFMWEDDSQVKRDIQDWVVKARKANSADFQELEDLLVCPISYEPWVNPLLCSDGRTYDKASLDKMGENCTSPFTREPLTVVRRHEEALEALNWLKESKR